MFLARRESATSLIGLESVRSQVFRLWAGKISGIGNGIGSRYRCLAC
jgi:hypothetical protein